jgi:hypothetical protein
MNVGKFWNLLDEQDRAHFLRAAYPQHSEALLKVEYSKRWGDLLPSTQKKLNSVDCTMALNYVNWKI